MVPKYCHTFLHFITSVIRICCTHGGHLCRFQVQWLQGYHVGSAVIGQHWLLQFSVYDVEIVECSSVKLLLTVIYSWPYSVLTL